MTDYLVPVILLVISVLALRKRESPYDLMLNGAADGLRLLFSIIPPLVLLLTAVSMLRASGALDFLTGLLSPALQLFSIPPEITPLLFIRPLSGSAALIVGVILAYRGKSLLTVSVAASAAVMVTEWIMKLL